MNSDGHPTVASTISPWFVTSPRQRLARSATFLSAGSRVLRGPQAGRQKGRQNSPAGKPALRGPSKQLAKSRFSAVRRIFGSPIPGFPRAGVACAPSRPRFRRNSSFALPSPRVSAENRHAGSQKNGFPWNFGFWASEKWTSCRKPSSVLPKAQFPAGTRILGARNPVFPTSLLSPARGRSFPAAIYTDPLTFIPFAWRRRWRASVWSAVAGGERG